jgi:hypothetical protein
LHDTGGGRNPPFDSLQAGLAAEVGRSTGGILPGWALWLAVVPDSPDCMVARGRERVETARRRAAGAGRGGVVGLTVITASGIMPS